MFWIESIIICLMKKLPFFCLFICLFLSVGNPLYSQAEQGGRSFTLESGEVIQSAKIEAILERTVYLEVSGGKSREVPVSDFVAQDQPYLIQWLQQNPQFPASVVVTTKRLRSDVSRASAFSTEAFEVYVTNRSKRPLKKVRVQWTADLDSRTVSETKKHSSKRPVSSSFQIESFADGQTKTFRTTPVMLRNERIASKTSNGGQRRIVVNNTQESLKNERVAVYEGLKLIWQSRPE